MRCGAPCANPGLIFLLVVFDPQDLKPSLVRTALSFQSKL
jgi:hypothetical protein